MNIPIEPFTNVDDYRRALATCIHAESNNDQVLAHKLRPRIDISPFSRCMVCGLKGVKLDEPPCERCNGYGFVPRVTRANRKGGRKPITGKFETREEYVQEIWRLKDFGVSRKQIAATVGGSEGTVSLIIDSREGREDGVFSIKEDPLAPNCHFKPMELVATKAGAFYRCVQCGHTHSNDREGRKLPPSPFA